MAVSDTTVSADRQARLAQYRQAGWHQWQQRQIRRERKNPRSLTLPDGTTVPARMSRIEGRVLVQFITALAAGIPPRRGHAVHVSRLWDEGILTADEMDELWRLAAGPERPFTDRDGLPQWDVILSGFETARSRH